MGNGARSWYFAFGLSVVLLLVNEAFGISFKTVPNDRIEVHFTRTPDGADLKVKRYANPGGPRAVLIPGLGAQADSLELPATALWEKGYDVFLANWRDSTELPSGMEPLSPTGRNGLPELSRFDFPTFVRFVRDGFPVAQGVNEKIVVLGHSMGGIMTMGGLTYPDVYEEFKNQIQGVVLFQSPHHVSYVTVLYQGLARAALPLIKTLRRQGMKTLPVRPLTIDLSFSLKQTGGFLKRNAALALEAIALQMVYYAFDPCHTDRASFNRACFKMAARRIPLDLLEDFARAVIRGGGFRNHLGGPLLLPELIRDIPVQVVSTTLDVLAPLEEQHEYFDALGTPIKQHVHLPDMNHIDSVLATKAESDFYPLIVAFADSPVDAVARASHIHFNMETGACEFLFAKK